MHLLQVCNVGQIVGGTAACAWSITRALPQMQHTVAFLSRVDDITRQTFAPHRIDQWPHCESRRIRDVSPDLVILHNVSSKHSSIWSEALTILYVHSTGQRLIADKTVYCSHWLAQQCRVSNHNVVWQGVPRPSLPALSVPRRDERIRIGRICTPTPRKWPDSLPDFYSTLTHQHPQVDWDFIGCPALMQPQLQSACNGRATFIPAGWTARSHVWNWDALLYHHPTLTESFGRTVAEAARAGCIPIVDDRGGFTEQLEVLAGRGCRTRQEFSDAIADLLSCPETRRSRSNRMQRLAEKHFSLSAFSERLRSLMGGLAQL